MRQPCEQRRLAPACVMKAFHVDELAQFTAVALFGRSSWRLLLDSRGVDVPMLSHLTFVILSSLKPLFFHGPQNV
jgi:hypothetical protein